MKTVSLLSTNAALDAINYALAEPGDTLVVAHEQVVGVASFFQFAVTVKRGNLCEFLVDYPTGPKEFWRLSRASSTPWRRLNGLDMRSFPSSSNSVGEQGTSRCESECSSVFVDRIGHVRSCACPHGAPAVRDVRRYVQRYDRDKTGVPRASSGAHWLTVAFVLRASKLTGEDVGFEGARAVIDISGEYPVYPGHPLTVTWEIMSVFNSPDEALKIYSDHGLNCPQAVADNRISGGGGELTVPATCCARRRGQSSGTDRMGRRTVGRRASWGSPESN